MADIELLINGKAYSGWKSAVIERSIEQIAGSFEVSVSEVAPNGDAAKDIMDGQPVTVRVAGQVVISGFVDDIEISHSATEHSITVRGRDATADLVDCAALSKQYDQQDMLAIIKDLIKDYKIAITSNTDLGAAFATWNIEPGETLFENIDKLARHRGVLVVSDGLGGLLLTQPGTQLINTALVLGENILRGQLTRSCQQRFSEYTILGERQRDDDNGPDTTKPRGTAKDAYITRKRPFVGCYEDANATIQSLNDRAAWQSRVNASKAQRAIITVQGWSHADGVWQPNNQVVVTDDRLRLNKATLLIAGVRHSLGAEGSTTDLTLLPRDAFLVDTVPEEIAQ